MATNINYTSTNDVRIYTINTANLNGNSNAFQYTFFLTLNSISVDRLVENYSYILKIDNKRSYTWTGAGTNITYKIFANTGSAGSTSSTYQRNTVSLPSFSNTSGNLYTLFSGSVTLTKQSVTDYSWFTIVLTNTTSGLTGTPAPMNYSYKAITTEVPLPLKLYPEESISAIAEAIRLANGGTSTYKLSQMPAAISRLPTPGAGDKSSFLSIPNVGWDTYVSILSPVCSQISKIRPEACWGLYMTSFSFPSVEWIGAQAFRSTLSWPSDTIYFSLCKYIGSSRFDTAAGSPNSVTTLSFPECTYIDYNAFGHMSWLSILSFPKCSYISKNAFCFDYAANNNIKTTLLSFPECTFVGASRFRGHYLVTQLSFPKLIELDQYRFADIGKSATNFVSYYMPNVKIIGDCAFSSAKLSIASFPKCSYIGSSAFISCSNLTTVYLPQVKVISNYCFNACSSLTTVGLSTVTTLGAGAFNRCINLSTIYLKNVESIYNSTFQSCYKLLSLYLSGSIVCPLQSKSAFNSTPISTYTTSTGGVYGRIYVPSSLYASYKIATNWTIFSSRFVSIT